MQNTFHELPALTVVVTGFNQESSIRGAIESVLNQDYAGKLEYIFSDDASSDGTFQIMREMEQAYRGSHSIKLNRNEQNMGITDHLEKVYSLASHEWVMRMDGDDRSFPHRCRILAEAIIKYPQARYIASDVELLTGRFSERHPPSDAPCVPPIRKSGICPCARTCMKLIGHGCMKDSWFCGTNSFCMLNTVPIFPGSIPG